VQQSRHTELADVTTTVNDLPASGQSTISTRPSSNAGPTLGDPLVGVDCDELLRFGIVPGLQPSSATARQRARSGVECTTKVLALPRPA
jgi:hypothetical protein